MSGTWTTPASPLGRLKPLLIRRRNLYLQVALSGIQLICRLQIHVIQRHWLICLGRTRRFALRHLMDVASNSLFPPECGIVRLRVL